MGEVGEDIKEAYQEVGITFTVLRDTGDISGEYCTLKENKQVTKPFIREYFQNAEFYWDTQARTGDVMQSSDGRHLMVMNVTPSMIADEIVANKSVAYKCNVSGQLQRFSGEATWDDNYNLTAAPVLVRDECFALLTEALYGNDMEENEELGNLGLQQHELYIPASYGAEVHDRYVVSDSEYYRIESIARRKYENIHVAIVGEDTR